MNGVRSSTSRSGGYSTTTGAAGSAPTPRPLAGGTADPVATQFAVQRLRSQRLAPRRHAKRTPYVVHVVLSLVWFALAVAGSPYYRLGFEDRLHHPWHAALKPNGVIGLAYGYAGTAMLLLLLLYSVRKRVRFLSRLGALRKWLAVHITCGLLGPGFITLHAGFRFHGAIAIGYWSMVCVMLSGFVGYYIYRQIPRAIAGRVNQSETLETEIRAFDLELAERYGLGVEDLERLRRASGADRAARFGPVRSLLFLVGQDIAFAFSFGVRRIRHPGLRRLGRRETKRLRWLVRQRVLVERRRAFLSQTESLFGYWHTIHKPFAIILYIMMGLHVGVAIWLGYAWAW